MYTYVSIRITEVSRYVIKVIECHGRKYGQSILIFEFKISPFYWVDRAMYMWIYQVRGSGLPCAMPRGAVFSGHTGM